MATPAVYKQSNVIFSVAGIPVEDIEEGAEISVEYDREKITKTLDVNRGGLFNVRNGRPAKISVPILQHSKWISILSGYRQTDMMIPVSLEDKNSYGNRQIFVSAHAMIQDPNVSYGEEASSRVFEFELIDLLDVTIPE